VVVVVMGEVLLSHLVLNSVLWIKCMFSPGIYTVGSVDVLKPGGERIGMMLRLKFSLVDSNYNP
jgi:hypothetical protein